MQSLNFTFSINFEKTQATLCKNCKFYNNMHFFCSKKKRIQPEYKKTQKTLFITWHSFEQMLKVFENKKFSIWFLIPNKILHHLTLFGVKTYLNAESIQSSTCSISRILSKTCKKMLTSKHGVCIKSHLFKIMPQNEDWTSQIQHFANFVNLNLRILSKSWFIYISQCNNCFPFHQAFLIILRFDHLHHFIVYNCLILKHFKAKFNQKTKFLK